MRISAVYLKACSRCQGDLYLTLDDGDDRELVCIQCGCRFGPPPTTDEPVSAPPEGMTSRQYVEELLSELAVGYSKEVPHVEWLSCRGAKEGCTLASAIREFRLRVPLKNFVQRHGYPSIWIQRIR